MGDTLTFIAQPAPGGGLNYDWFSLANWFVPTPDGFSHVYRLPQAGETAVLQTDVNAAATSIQVGSIQVQNNVTVTGGNFTLDFLNMQPGSKFTGSSIIIRGSFTTDGPTYLNACRLTLQAGASALLGYTTPRTSGSLSLDADTLIENIGSFVLSSNTVLGAIGSCRFHNQPNADLRANGDASVTAGGGDFVFDNEGTVISEKGTLSLTSLRWTSSSPSGNFLAASPASTNSFTGATMVVSNGVIFTFKGPGTHRFTCNLKVDGAIQVGVIDPLTHIVDPGQVEFAPATGTDGSGTVHLIAQPDVPSTFNWRSGYLGVGQFDIDAGGQLLISGVGGSGTAFFDSGNLNNSGTISVVGTSGMRFDSGTVLNNLVGGSIEIATDASLSGTGAITPNFNNQGRFRKSGGNGTSQVALATHNSGTVEIESGALSFQRGYTQTAGSTVVTAGHTASSSGTGFDIQGGTLSGSGTLIGPVNNGGRVAPGASPGVLILGNSSAYAQQTNGNLDIEIGGTTAGIDYDQLSVGGAATLDGTLNVSFVNGFVPKPGDTFNVLTFTSRTGTFASFNGLQSGTGYQLMPVYSATNLILVASSVTTTLPKLSLAISPPPQSRAELTWNCAPGRQYQIQYSEDLENWLALTNITATGASISFTDPVPSPSPRARFYRLR